MRIYRKIVERCLCMVIGLTLIANAFAQQSATAVRGQIADELGGVIAGVTVRLIDPNGAQKTVTTNAQGAFVFSDVAPGKYILRVSAEGFAEYENADLDITTVSREPISIKLRVALAQQKTTVTSTDARLSTDPDNNAGAVVIKGKDLDTLPDDPDDLANALRAMAGPAAGPNGGQLYIDGFSGGALPRKEAIQEIRINQNPFAAENDRIGFGRIDILTKPGRGSYHGMLTANYNDQNLNSRNPFSPNRPRFQFRGYGGNFSGPLVANRATFFINAFRREIDDNAIINATVLDAGFNIARFNQAVVTPRRFIDINPRVDYQLSKNNSLTVRYNFSSVTLSNMGIGEFSLPSRASNTSGVEHTLQLTETAILSSAVVNETRLQYIRNSRDQVGDNTIPTILVQDAFIGGGSQIGTSFAHTNRGELQNYTTWATRKHTFKFGGRLRIAHIEDSSPSNFGGTYIFLGGMAPMLDASNEMLRGPNGQPIVSNITSLERYRRTLLLQQRGLSPSDITALGGGATFLTIATGNPLADVSQLDIGSFFQEDWRLRANFTLSYGLRYEMQTNIDGNASFAPRIAFAWSPDANASRSPKTVIRGGMGIFYERIADSLTLQAHRFNGFNQKQFTISDANVLGVFPSVPSLDALSAFSQKPNIIQVAGDIVAPYTIQSGISIERQLPFRFTVTATYTNARGLHYLRSRNINAPLPITKFDSTAALRVARPFENAGNIFDYESSGAFKQNQLIINASNRMSRIFTLFANYAFSKTSSDTDGVGTFPANTYDLAGEFSRSSLDVRHRAFVGGSISLPWGLSLNPFALLASGTPFNITTGLDTNGDTLATERPAFATDLSKPGVKVTRFGAFDLNPAPGQQIIPRNFGQGSGYFSASLRVSKTIGFGRPASAKTAASAQQQVNPSTSSAPRRQWSRYGNQAGGPSSEKPYRLGISLYLTNVLNHTNPGAPVGNLSSPLFGQSTSLGVLGGVGLGGGGNLAASNRRIDLSIQFSF